MILYVASAFARRFVAPQQVPRAGYRERVAHPQVDISAAVEVVYGIPVCMLARTDSVGVRWAAFGPSPGHVQRSSIVRSAEH